MYKNQKGLAPIIIALIVLVLAGVGGISYYLINKQLPKQIACTEEAKLCPDGSSVGRTGPNCEFTVCPEVKTDETVNWTTYKNDKYGFEIKYPSDYSLFQGTDPIKAKLIPADLNSQQIFITDRPEMFFCCDPIYVSIEILDTYITDLEKYLSDQKIINSDNNYRVKTKGYITFNGEQAYQVQSEFGMDSPGNIILVNHNSKTYYIEDNGLSSSDKIISTFKFINSETKTNIFYKTDFNGDDLTGRLYKSEDNGKTWKKILEQYKGEIVYAVDSKNSDIIYAGDVMGNMMANDMDIDLYKSVDAGEHWVDISKGIVDQVGILFGFVSLSIDSNNPNIINVVVSTEGANNVNFKSLDGGSTWTK